MTLYNPGFPKVNTCHFGTTKAQVDSPRSVFRLGPGPGRGGTWATEGSPNMDNQITATVELQFESGKQFLQVSFLAECGCHWVVDMWGNVRSVTVCSHCRLVPDVWEDQLTLLLVADE